MSVVALPILPPDDYRSRLSESEWQKSLVFEGARRAEHVAGQLAARTALQSFIGPTADEMAIDRDEHGAPVVHGAGESLLVSISHGRLTAVAVAARASMLGIDICEHADAIRVRRVTVRFVSSDEVALVNDAGVHRWTALWALKEASAKALRRGLLDGGLRATCLASIDPPRFVWPALDAAVVYRTADTVAVVYKE